MKNYEVYFYIVKWCESIQETFWINDGFDRERLESGNMFYTREEAEEKLKEMKEN